MDAVVDRLAGAFATGEKSLVFVRRVASVDDLQRKMNEMRKANVERKALTYEPGDLVLVFEHIRARDHAARTVAEHIDRQSRIL